MKFRTILTDDKKVFFVCTNLCNFFFGRDGLLLRISRKFSVRQK